MTNPGGWLLLTLIFSGLILLVQRSERKRRIISFLVLASVWSVVWGYGIYRMSTECNESFRALCNFKVVRDHAAAIAWNTTNLAALTALVFNLLFWILIGRSNPPGSSDSIKVLGMND